MLSTLDDQINQLRQTIADFESQRFILGDGGVDDSRTLLCQILADLDPEVDRSINSLVDVLQSKHMRVRLIISRLQVSSNLGSIFRADS
jgi:hypothetical protein